MFDGNGGKVAEVNGVRIVYYPCMTNNKTLTGVTHYPTRGLSGQFPVTFNKRFQYACRSLGGNGGKVQRIGDLTFSYYPSTQFDHNAGKLQRVGRYTFSYYGPNSFKGKAGQLKNNTN